MGPRKRKDIDAKVNETEKCDHSDVKKAGNSNSEKSIIPYRRIAIRFFLLIFAMVALNLYSRLSISEETFVSSQDLTQKKTAVVPCSRDYDDEKRKFSACVPRWCGRAVMDQVVSRDEARHLLGMAKAGLALGGSNGGASILDIHSGALSHGDKFINIFKIIEETDNAVFTEEDFTLYSEVKNKIHAAIASVFGIKKDSLYLTKPTFFSRMDTKSAKTIHDEYWHVHTDKVTYGSFHYTSLLYLSTYNTDFTGGRFIFADQGKNTTVEPTLGRLSFFTSGSENPHFVEKLKSGTRYAITVSFTCDPNKAISDPRLRTSKN